MTANLIEAVHAAGGALHEEEQWNAAAVQTIFLDTQQMTGDQRGQIVANHHNLFCLIVHKDPNQTVYQSFFSYPHQRLGVFYSLCR